jgi:hypothetical protein
MFASVGLVRSWEEVAKAYFSVQSRDSVGQTGKLDRNLIRIFGCLPKQGGNVADSANLLDAS